MGTNKAELLLKGRRFADILLEKANGLGMKHIYISGCDVVKESVHTVWDIFPERGPLGGLHACMRQMTTPFCMVLPIDVPQIPIELLDEMLTLHDKGCVTEEGRRLPLLLEHGGRLEHLIGIYPISMVDFIEEKIKNHPFAVHRMLGEWGVLKYQKDILSWKVENINTREAYEELLLKYREG